MKNDQRKKLVLLDSHAILHRAYHALPDFMSSKGEPTGALYGLSTMLMKIFDEINPDYVVACFDLPAPTHRHEAYKEYKAGRKKTDSELVSQIIRSKDVFKAFSIPQYEASGFEADDILGTIVEQMKDNEEVDIVVASGDMDTLQLVRGDRVVVYTLKKGIKDTIIYNEKGVIERFGFVPSLLPDYKGLRGDTSDNIIGIKGIGEKTASILIQTFGTIENLYKVLKKEPQKIKDAGCSDRIVELLKNGEEEAIFSKMLALIRRDAPIDFKIPKKIWREEVDIKNIESIFKELEFRALSSRVANLIDGKKSNFKSEESTNEADSQSKDAEIIAKNPILFKKASIGLWVLDSNVYNPTLKEILDFANTDSLEKAFDIIFSEIKKRNLLKVFEEIELPLISIVEKMEKRGILIDIKYLKNLSVEFHKEIMEIEKEAQSLAGKEFNVSSPKQLGEILFDTLHLKVGKKTAGGARSTKESELLKLKDSHPIVPLILRHRELSKLVGTYIDTIPQQTDSERILHTSYIQNGTTTGRMSSINPNLQNIPIKTPDGRKIRNAFIARQGFKLASFDYSQIELRIATFLSKDQTLIDIFKNNRDVHTEVASKVFGVPKDLVDKEMRRRAKVVNFGIIYGMGVNALKQNLSEGGSVVSRTDAQQFYNEYFKNFSGLAEYLNKTKSEASRLGFTETFFGRRRYFEGIKSKIPFIRASAERMAINAPIQGTGADIVKLASIKIQQYIESKGLEKDVYLLLQVHDELIYEINEKLLPKVAEDIKSIMEEVINPKDIFDIVMKAEYAIGNTWGELK